MGSLDTARVGIVGLGSIGRRHARELYAAGAEVLALRRPGGSGSRSDADLHVTEFTDREAFWGAGLDAVVIANPTALHVESLTIALQRTEAVVLVEKPIAGSIREAETIPEGWWDRVRVGYCLRFHPVIRAVRRVIERGAVGQVLSGTIRFGSSLPQWQPDADYRRSYAARRVLGGGVLRTLSHELDLVQHLAGTVRGVTGQVGHVSPLEIDAEDVAQLSFRTSGGAMVAVDLDYFTPGYVRTGSIVGTSGRIDYSLNPGACRVAVTTDGGTEHSDGLGDVDEMYAAQTADLLAWAAGVPSSACTFPEAMDVLKMIEAAERLSVTQL